MYMWRAIVLPDSGSDGVLKIETDGLEDEYAVLTVYRP